MVITNETVIEYYRKRHSESPEVIKFDQDELEVINFFGAWELSIVEGFCERNCRKDFFRKGNPIYVFQKLTDFCEYPKYSNKEQASRGFNYLKEEDFDLIDDYNKKNSKSMIIDRDTKFDFNFAWYEDDDVITGSEKNTKYPFLELSRIGFNKDKSKCIINSGYSIAELNGSGGIWVFQKKQQDSGVFEWEPLNIESPMIWMS